MKPDMMLWLDDNRGVYIPRDFAKSFADRVKHVAGVSDEDWLILESGPDHDLYWDTWIEVCENAKVTDENGNKFFLYQDGALWLVPVGMEWNESNESFDWPSEDDDDFPATDPDHDEMVAFLKTTPFAGEADEVDIESAIYWFASDYHGGQSTSLYSALSTSDYRPGPMESGVDTESTAGMLYDALEERFAPK